MFKWIKRLFANVNDLNRENRQNLREYKVGRNHAIYRTRSTEVETLPLTFPDKPRVPSRRKSSDTHTADPMIPVYAAPVVSSLCDTSQSSYSSYSSCDSGSSSSDGGGGGGD